MGLRHDRALMPTSTALRLTGRDVLTVLHRIGTNALEDLAVGQARATLFCDFRGRMLHRTLVVPVADGSVWLLRDDAPGEALAAFIDRFVFREDLHIEDLSADWAVSRHLETSAAFVEERDGRPLRFASGDGTAYLVGTGGPFDERARIAHGIPRHGHEIVEDFTPFEVGLAHEVHLDKGCFTGQEALMRLVTYDSVRRQLARVTLSAENTPALPSDITKAGARVGRLTSAAGRDALAVLRKDALEGAADLALADGTRVEVAHAFEPTRPLGRP